MNISQNSWHYKLVLWYHDGYTSYIPKDICTYTRQLIFAIGLGSILLSFSILCISFLTHAIVALGFVPFYGFDILMDFDALVLSILTTVIVIPIIFVSGKFLNRYLRNSEEHFVSAAYSSWKNKFCIRLNFTKD